jgi:hypothetical protein
MAAAHRRSGGLRPVHQAERGRARLLDYARSAVVDDAKPRVLNLERLEMLRVFFFQGTRLVQGGRKFWLIELPD